MPFAIHPPICVPLVFRICIQQKSAPEHLKDLCHSYKYRITNVRSFVNTVFGLLSGRTKKMLLFTVNVIQLSRMR